MGLNLFDYQIGAIKKMHNGCILVGGVGSGKSRTSLGYYYIQNGGEYPALGSGKFKRLSNEKDLYIITTARKRDTHDWELEMAPFRFQKNPVVDSWNNISKYVGVKNSFFIFDEQRVVGKGKWAWSFLEISKHNDWILLSATPGDCWSDYIPVFLANNFYRNRSDFIHQHVIYNPYMKFRKIDRYINTGRLIRLRDSILVDMDFHRSTIAHHNDVKVDYDKIIYKSILKDRWNPYTNEPISNASELCMTLRKLVNSDPDRVEKILHICKKHNRCIIFYSYDYELDILLNIDYGEGCTVAQWNGHMHQEIPSTDKWIYLVQYTAGAEGWNCIKTDTIIFYSQQYSYKVLEQSCGRIDRLNTPFKDLYYYHLISTSSIDLAISRALNSKKNFTEGNFAKF